MTEPPEPIALDAAAAAAAVRRRLGEPGELLGRTRVGQLR
jgi:hypothetical protein